MSELAGSAPDAARRLLGCELERTLENGAVIRVRIVETEAYDELDPGSHTYRGKTPRNTIMYGQAGHLYVYFIYGMHYCCNVVTGPEGHGEAALIRAVEPIAGTGAMQALRPNVQGATLTNGPAKLCSALAISRELNGHNLSCTPLRLILRPPLADNTITQTTRVGLKQGTTTPWRFYITGNQYVSKPSS